MPGKHTVTLKSVPADVRATVLKEQSDHQIKCGCRFSQEKTFFKIVRMWAKIKNFQHNGIPMKQIAEEM